MVSSCDSDKSKSNISVAVNAAKKPADSKMLKPTKTSSEKMFDAGEPKRPASQAHRRSLKPGPKLPEMSNLCDKPTPGPLICDPADDGQLLEKLDLIQSETYSERKKPEGKESPPIEGHPAAEIMADAVDWDLQKKTSVETKPPDGGGRVARHRRDSPCKRPSEIPKLKTLSKVAQRTQPKVNSHQSKLPVKTPPVKEVEQKQKEKASVGGKTKEKGPKGKKEGKGGEKVKEAMEADFSYVVPLYEKEFKRISEVWGSTMYCSLTMRANLVKLLFQAFPHVSKEQFHTEDEKLLHCLAHAKSSTALEAESLIKFVKNMLANREKMKEEYSLLLANKEIADLYNNDWRQLIRKVSDLGEDMKLLQIETPELQRKKEANETIINEKIRRMEVNLCKKEDELKKLANQLNLLRQKESVYKENVLMKIPDYKEIKADVKSLISTQKEFDELRAKYLFQNYLYEKKIKDLENLLEEKKKVLDKERNVKVQLQGLLVQLQAHQKRLTTTIGKEQVDYVMGRSLQGREKRGEQLWLAAVKLVLRGFLMQMRRLERDRNKMLIEIQTNESENFGDFATIIQKENFIKSIRQQVCDLQKLCNCPNELRQRQKQRMERFFNQEGDSPIWP